MCGRFALISDGSLIAGVFRLKAIPSLAGPQFNIAPGQRIAAILNLADPALEFLRWGLVPSWAKDPKIGYRMINARAETVAEKPAFRAALRHRRCLIPADGFFEWMKTGKAKQPMFVRLKSRTPFALAGLWESWNAPDGSKLKSATILTTGPNALMKKIHDRMPVILPPEAWEAWLNPEQGKPDLFKDLLKPFPAKDMEAYPVSTLVNSPKNNVKEVLAPLDPPA
jgi:putative SOS response-associated peptidase YedK